MSHTNYNGLSNKAKDNVNESVNTPIPEDKTSVPETTLESITQTETEVPPPAPEPVIGTVVGCTKLNVRKDPNLFADIICEINKGTQVLVIVEESSDEWCKVDIGGQTGFCMKQYMTIDE